LFHLQVSISPPTPGTSITYRQGHSHCLSKRHLMETGPLVAREGAKDRAGMLKTIQMQLRHSWVAPSEYWYFSALYRCVPIAQRKA